jgi:hypothetical protein
MLLARRAKLRKLKLLPISVCPMTLNLNALPTILIPATLQAEPRRTKDRTLMLLPANAVSRTLKV